VNRPASLTAKMKTADIELRNYIMELEKKNLKLHDKLAKLQVQNVSQQNEIKAIQKEIKALKNGEIKGAFSHLSTDDLKNILKET
jgi:hypothetical protein